MMGIVRAKHKPSVRDNPERWVSKTNAAAMAHATKGRARVFDDKTKKKDKNKIKKQINEGLKEYNEKVN